MNYRNTYKLLIMGGMAPFKMEVLADSVLLTDKGVFIFKRGKKNVAYYPIATTIIQDVEKNEDYEGPEEPQNRVGNRLDLAAVRAMIDRNA